MTQQLDVQAEITPLDVKTGYKLAVIGHCTENLLLGGGFTDGLREKGFELFTISSDLNFPWRVAGYKTKEDWFTHGMKHPNFDFHIFSAEKAWGGYCHNEEHARGIQYGYEPVVVRQILEKADVYPDGILLTPSQDITFDFAGIPADMPVYYLFTGAVCWPRWPLNARVKGFFYGYGEAPQTFKDLYPVQWKRLDFAQFLPNAYSSKSWYPKRTDHLEEKQHFLGFMGKTDFDRGTFFSQQLYINRQKYLNFLIDKYALTYNGFQAVKECREFLQNTFLGLNVSAFGVNMRQFEVPACGALLLQHVNQDSKKTGLVDKENCLLFTDYASLEKQVEWAFSHLDEANQIRLNGMEYAQNNTFYHRGLECGNVLNRHLTLFKGNQKGKETTPPNDQNLVNSSG